MALERIDSRMEIDSRGELECKLSDNPRRELEREEEKMVPPGPASSKGGRVTRSRSSSVTSDSSNKGNARKAVAEARRSSRRASFETNRHAAEVADPEQGEEGTSVVVLSDDTEEEEEFFSPSPSREPSLKRKMEIGEEVPEATQRKQGRPQTTGLYVGRAKAQGELNKELKETAELEWESTLRRMSAGRIIANVERNVDAFVEKMEFAPTADVAQRTREQMAEVIRVANSSKHLNGVCIKILKQAAACGMAATEVLRTRADSGESPSEGDILWQLKAMRRELEDAKQEARAAKEETEALRKELAEAQQRRGRGRRRAIVDDSDYSPTPSPATGTRPHGEIAEEPTTAAPMDEDTPMGTDGAEMGESTTPTYSDERRKKEILPPREKWPDALRPPLRGQVKILEDRLLTDHTVKMVKDDRGLRSEGFDTQSGTREKGKGDALSLMKQLAPLLESWLRDNLLSLGIQATGKEKGTLDPQAKAKPKGGKKAGKLNPPPDRQGYGTTESGREDRSHYGP